MYLHEKVPFSITVADLEATKREFNPERHTGFFDPKICPLFQAAKRFLNDSNIKVGNFTIITWNRSYSLDKPFFSENLELLQLGAEHHTVIKRDR